MHCKAYIIIIIIKGGLKRLLTWEIYEVFSDTLKIREFCVQALFPKISAGNPVVGAL